MRGLSTFHNEQHDIDFDDSGNLRLVTGEDEIVERISTYLLTDKGEYSDDPEFGIDSKYYRERPEAEWPLIRRDLISKVTDITGVKMVDNLDISIDPKTRRLVFDLRITTETDSQIDLIV